MVLGAEGAPVASTVAGEQPGRVCALGRQGAQSSGRGNKRAEGERAAPVHHLGRDQDGAEVGGEAKNAGGALCGLPDL